MKRGKMHIVLPGSKRPKDPGTVRIRDVDPTEKIDVTIALSGPKLPGADEYVGQTLTPDELSTKFGTKKADADKGNRGKSPGIGMIIRFPRRGESHSLPTCRRPQTSMAFRTPISRVWC